MKNCQKTEKMLYLPQSKIKLSIAIACFRGGRRWTCVGFYILGGLFALAVGVLKSTGTQNNSCFESGCTRVHAC